MNNDEKIAGKLLNMPADKLLEQYPFIRLLHNNGFDFMVVPSECNIDAMAFVRELSAIRDASSGDEVVAFDVVGANTGSITLGTWVGTEHDEGEIDGELLEVLDALRKVE